jgi:hypothetical protein
MNDVINCPPVEVHVTHTCNLSCRGCNHYSNYKLERWQIDEQEFERWIAAWAGRIAPSTFNILGGEPTLHPKLIPLLQIAARYFKAGRHDPLGGDNPICLITNGRFLHRHSGLKEVLQEHRIRLFLSVHYERRPEVLETVTEWQRSGVAVTIYDYSVQKEWRQFYRGHGRSMLPYQDNQPERSWDQCIAKRYFQLYDGKLWKCANLAYLSLAKKALGLSPDWDKYLAYRPLEPTASTAEIEAFFAQEAEDVCGMCPAHPEIVENTRDDEQ